MTTELRIHESLALFVQLHRRAARTRDRPTQKASPTRRVCKMALTNPTARPVQNTLPVAPAASSDKAARILAKSLFRQLKDAGYQNRDILTLSTELVSLITTDMRPEGTAKKA